MNKQKIENEIFKEYKHSGIVLGLWILIIILYVIFNRPSIHTVLIIMTIIVTTSIQLSNTTKQNMILTNLK